MLHTNCGTRNEGLTQCREGITLSSPSHKFPRSATATIPHSSAQRVGDVHARVCFGKNGWCVRDGLHACHCKRKRKRTLWLLAQKQDTSGVMYGLSWRTGRTNWARSHRRGTGKSAACCSRRILVALANTPCRTCLASRASVSPAPVPARNAKKSLSRRKRGGPQHVQRWN